VYFFNLCKRLFSNNLTRLASFSLYIDLMIDTDTIPFHLKSTENIIVFNSESKGDWLGEMKLISNPFVVNIPFTINIIIDTNEGFDVNF
jgi:hypothetical protein